MALYPPIVASSMPAFGITVKGRGQVKIYFTLSDYNSAKDIKAVHVSIRRQSSNANVLKSSTQIMQAEMLQSKQDKILNRYQIKITSDNIIGDVFENNVFYKVQLRFSEVRAESEADFTTDFLNKNINKFSEWSTVCLIKPVIKPKFYIEDFVTEDFLVQDSNIEQKEDENTFYSRLADFVGVYSPGQGKQVLKSWRLRLLDQSYQDKYSANIDEYTLADSGIITVTAYNYTLNNNTLVFTCSLPYQFKENEKHYKLLFEIQTRNGYTAKSLMDFTSIITGMSKPDVTLSYSINEQDGYIKVIMDHNIMTSTNLVLRRTDSTSNFLKWEDLKFFKVGSTDQQIIYYDFTAQSGTLYKYLVQEIDIRGRRSAPVYAQYENGPETIDVPGVILEYEHPFLLESTGNGNISKAKQLKMKFDFQISSYKQNVLESKTDTIGSQYPFIKRNGDTYYRSFDCSGTITGFMDEAELFVTKNNLYDNKKDLYDMFKGEITNYIDQYDYTYERKFREKVEQFLYNTKPKLYKSMQEGNIFIKLMNVSLTPKNELGRLIYTFSATAYQIAPSTIQSYISYGLINPGTYDTSLAETFSVLGQVNSYTPSKQDIATVFKANRDVIGAGSGAAANSIAKKINYKKSIDGMICNNFEIDWLRITVESPPYLIVRDGSKYRPVDDIDDGKIDSIKNPSNKLYQMERTHEIFNNIKKDTEIYLGTLFELTVNGDTQTIIVAPPNNIYELNESNLTLNGASSHLVPLKDTLMTVDYHINYEKQVDESTVPVKVRTQIVTGQLPLTHFEENTNIVSKINYKYLFTEAQDSKKVKTIVRGIPSIAIDTNPGTKVLVKTKGSVLEEEFIVNHTGELNIDLSSQPDEYISSYIIQNSVDALVFYSAIIKKQYYI